MIRQARFLLACAHNLFAGLTDQASQVDVPEPLRATERRAVHEGFWSAGIVAQRP
jgi:hypothetical protein